ncbi:hypothetical protein HNQ91_002083 [Filimonas zeae]|uniref:hypothetical protein n=1 Tax=Filimonas zeae TaxID=1737353 RepID=UPI001662A4BD|nr:hypothetical protein [Filimonas zeae]MDR6339032.1 hypothetical protein [Filimonas zeae]
MNKYNNIIRDFLLQHKQLTLGKIGSFTIVNEPAAGVDAGNVVFVADKKAETSSALLDQIAEKSGKGRGLVAADLESYLEQMRQFINIGKPYVIEDVGVVSLNKSGNYEFSRNAATLSLTSPVGQAAEQHFLPESTGGTARTGKRNGIMGLAAVIILLVLAGVGYGIYNMARNGKSNTATTDTETTEQPATDTPAAATSATASGDGTAVNPDTTAAITTTTAAPAVTTAVSGDSAHYRFVFETTASSERAHARTAQLKSFGDPAGFDSSKQEDGTFSYRLFLRQKIAIADSTRAKDSVQLYLSKSVRLVKE